MGKRKNVYCVYYKRKRNERKTNECFTLTIRKTHDTRTKELCGKRKRTNARYTKRTNDTRSERTMHERTNHWSVAIYYPMTNDPGSIEVQYSIVLLFE
jgi:hypothetical protein